MRILFDHGTPSGIARRLAGHSVTEARDLGWDRISNGELLTAAEAAGFDVLLTTDKNIGLSTSLTPYIGLRQGFYLLVVESMFYSEYKAKRRICP